MMKGFVPNEIKPEIKKDFDDEMNFLMGRLFQLTHGRGYVSSGVTKNLLYYSYVKYPVEK